MTIALGRRWRRATGIVLMMLLLFTAGYAARAARLWDTPGERSAEVGFARDMSSHHAQAVELAMIAWQRGSRPETRSMAYATVTAQQAQIGIMQTWLAGWHRAPTAGGPPMAWVPGGAAMLTDGRMPGMAGRDELDGLARASGTAVDVLFCRLMIRHHLGGLHMIDAVLARSRWPEVVELARAMRAKQSAEVANMQQLLTAMGATM